MGILLQVGAVYWAPLRLILGTVPLSVWEFVDGAFIGASLLVASEGYKIALARKRARATAGNAGA